jgi:hypothetical protein
MGCTLDIHEHTIQLKPVKQLAAEQVRSLFHVSREVVQ